MMGCRMTRSLNVRWTFQQTFPLISAIVAKYPEIFTDAPVTDTINLDGEVTVSAEDA